MKCLNCGKAVKQTTGKRAKTYCNEKCRQTHWQKKNKEAHPPARKPGRPKKEEKAPLVVTITEIDNVVTERRDLKVMSQEPVELVDKGELQNQIAAIKAEKIPKHRDTTFGRKSWAIDQQKRIQKLQNDLNGISV